MWALVLFFNEHWKVMSAASAPFVLAGKWAWPRLKARYMFWREMREHRKQAWLRVERIIGTNGGGTIFDGLAKVQKEVITNREEMHEAFALAESVSDSTPPQLRWDVDGNVVRCSRQFTRAFGWSMPDLEHGWRSKLTTQGQIVWDRVAGFKESYDGPLAIRTWDGGLRELPVFIRPMFMPTGKFIGFIGTFDEREKKK